MGGAASFAAGPGEIVPGPERAMALEWIPQRGKQLSLLIVCALLPIKSAPLTEAPPIIPTKNRAEVAYSQQHLSLSYRKPASQRIYTRDRDCPINNA